MQLINTAQSLLKGRPLVLLFCLSLSGLVAAKPIKVKTGFWYTSFQLSGNGEFLPVIFEIKKEKKFSQISIINGSEHILLENVEQKKDSVFVRFPAFASEFRAKIHTKKHISGRWYNHAKKGNYYLPFWSKYEYATKYPPKEPSIDIGGRWEVTFDYQKEPEKAVGIFASSSHKSFNGMELKNRITGTFLTETGDYRFLEGATINDSLYLSTFDGSHAFLFKAKFQKDTLWGEFLSGNHYRTNWFAVKNKSFELRSPDSLTTVETEAPITFSLPSITGDQYSYPNETTKGKVTLIQIMGTWCPNCLDESMYLKNLTGRHKDSLDVIAVTFETQKSLEDKIAKVSSYKDNLGLSYTFLIGGDACKSCASDMFPMLSDIISFPTLIFIDKTGAIRKVHTGFNGPGTGTYYNQFVSSTNDFIQALINE
jgi:thiol-disulfide isomerase/thioredoxin